ncbi:hypothetical protein ACFYOV_10645 [Streptomyces sp. NPDC005931]|uniref:hypothetical protein n=1 Tax=Streptomyces sp. NPDC005931 TaxID=3364737 RepID=UPI0036C4EC9D
MTPTNDPAPPPAGNAGGQAGTDDDYSATVLASHWIQRPDPDTVRDPAAATLEDRATVPDPAAVADPASATAAATARYDGTPSAAGVGPDRIEGTVLRFGPGVRAALEHRSHVTLPTVEPPASPARRGWRRHALPAVVLLAVLAFLAWQRYGPGPTVRQVSVAADPATVGCDGTADLVATVATDGRPGTLSYRWVRSDGTRSGVLEEKLARGRTQARLHLLWSFEGRGRYEARAELRILAPTDRTATVRLTYDCP